MAASSYQAVLCLVTTLMVQFQALAQVAPSDANSGARGLKVLVLEGADAINHVPTRSGTAPVVEIRDDNDRPVEGATVTFELPATGPGALFKDGRLSQSTTSDVRGQAGANGYVVNGMTGRFSIKVSATLKGYRSAAILIHQLNSMQTPDAIRSSQKWHHKRWVWAVTGCAAAGLAGGIYFATRGSSPPVTVSVGSPGFGIPK